MTSSPYFKRHTLLQALAGFLNVSKSRYLAAAHWGPNVEPHSSSLRPYTQPSFSSTLLAVYNAKYSYYIYFWLQSYWVSGSSIALVDFRKHVLHLKGIYFFFLSFYDWNLFLRNVTPIETVQIKLTKTRPNKVKTKHPDSEMDSITIDS